MKISLLRQKEDFNTVFAKSLSQYLTSRFSWQGDIAWDNSLGTAKFIVNDQLNVIYPAHINRNLLAPLTAEFKWHKNPARHLLQTIYTYLAVRFPFESFMSSGSCCITHAENILPNIVFIPGNHSHRLINENKNISTVFHKWQSNVLLTITDAKIRLEHAYLHVPKVLEHNFQEGWYDEERVIGLPYNRLSDKNLQQKIITQCRQDLHLLYQKNNEIVPVKEYVETLTDKATFLLSGYSDPEALSSIKNTVNKIMILLNEHLAAPVSLVLTHGDFQPANILCTEQNFWIIDWEYAQNRSIFYDALIFELSARFSHDLSSRLIILKNKVDTGECFFSWSGEELDRGKVYYLYLFLLEDIILKLHENAVNDTSKINENILCYINEISTFLLSK